MGQAGGRIEYETDRLKGRLELGELNFSAANPLVAESFQMPGARVEMGLPDERVSLSLGGSLAALERAFSGASSSVAQPSSAAGGTTEKRGIAELTVALARTRATDLVLRGSYFEAEDTVAQTSPGGHRNRILGAGSDLSLFSGRLHVANDFGWSRYREGDGGAVDADTGARAAHRHHMDVTAWNDDSLRVALYGTRQRVGSAYESIEANFAADRDTLAYGGAIDWETISAEFFRTAFTNNIERDPSKTSTGELEDRLAYSVDLESDTDQSPRGPEAMLPSTLSLSLTRTHAVAAHDGDLFTLSDAADEHTTSYALDLSWERNRLSNALSLSRDVRDDDMAGGTESDAYSLDVAPRYRGDGWNIAGGVSATRTEKSAWTRPGHALSTDIDLGLAPRSLPDLAFESALSWEESGADGAEQEEVSSRLLAALDFSKYLPDGAREGDAFLKTEASYARSWHAQAEPTEAAWTISGGITF